MSIKHRRYTDMVLILSSLFIVSGALSFWHGMKKENDIDATNQITIALDTTVESNDLIMPTPPQLLKHKEHPLPVNTAQKSYLLEPLLASRDVQKIAILLRNDPVVQVAELTKKLVNDPKSLLSYADKVELIFSLALNYPHLNEQSLLFNIFIDNRELFLTSKKHPLLFISANRFYINIVQNLLAWAKDNEKNYKGLYQKIITEGLSAIVSHDKVDKLALLIQANVPITQKEATALLWKVIQQNKDPHFVSLLKDCGAQLDVIENKKTPLIQAVINDNFELTKALLNADAQIGLIPDPETGSALQNALLTKHTKIELLLRERGAKE